MPETRQFNPIVAYDLMATIADGQTKSGEIDLAGGTLCGIQFDAGFDGTTLGFEMSTSSGGTFTEVLDSTGTAISKTVAASKYITILPHEVAGLRFIKLVASSQTGSTSATLAIRPV